MTPSNIDIDITFNPASIIENFRKVQKAFDNMMKGVEGAGPVFNKVFGDFSQQVASMEGRMSRAERSARSFIQTAESYGKTEAQRMTQRYESVVQGLGKNEKMIQQVTKAYQELTKAQKEQAQAGRETELRGLERQAKMAGMAKTEQYAFRITEVKASGDSQANINREVAALERLIQVEKQATAAAKERDLQALERQSKMAGMSRLEQRQYEVQEAKDRGETPEYIDRMTASVERFTAAEKKEADAARERNLVALERQAKMAGMSREEQTQFRVGEVRASGRSPEEIEREVAAITKLDEVEKREAATRRERNIAEQEFRASIARLSPEEQETQLLERKARAEGYDEEAIRRLTAAQRELNAVRANKEATAAAEQREKSLLSLEERADLAGKKGVERIRLEEQMELRRRKALGATEEELRRVTAAYQKFVVVEEEDQRKGGGAGTGNLLFRGLRDIYEGRMAYGTMDLGRAAGQIVSGKATGEGGALAGIGAAIPIVGGLTVAVGGLAAASYEAAKGFGEYAEGIREIQEVTGMTAREAQQWDYAIKLAGADANVTARFMKGLSEAVTDTGAAGDKARRSVEATGIDLYKLQSGQMSATQALIQFAEGVDKQTDAFKKSKEMRDLLNRMNLESVATLMKLKTAIEQTKDVDLPSQKQLDEGVKFHDALKAMNFEFDQMKIKSEAALAPFFTRMATAGALFFHGTGMGQLSFLGQAMGIGGGAPAQPAAGPTPAEAETKRRKDAADAAAETRQKADNASYLRSLQTNIEYQTREETRLKQAFDALLPPANLTATRDEREAARIAYENQRQLVEQLHQNETDQKAIQEALRRSGLFAEQRAENPFMLPAEAELNRVLRLRGLDLQGPQAAQLRKEYAPQIEFERTQQINKLQDQMQATYETISREQFRARLGGIQQVDIRGLGGPEGTTRADVEADINERYRQRLDIAHQIEVSEEGFINARKIDSRDAVALAQKDRDLLKAAGDEQTARIVADMEKRQEMYRLIKEASDQETKHRIEMSKIQLDDQEDQIKYEAQLEERRAQLRFKGESPAAGIRESLRIQLDAAQQLYEVHEKQIDLEEKGWEAARDHALNLRDLDKERYRAQEEAELKLAEMQQQQLDSLKSKIEPLYHTLFTDPKNFGKQLRSTVTEAALHPIVSGLSDVTARALHPLIYGATGEGGIAGAFGNIFGVGGKPDGSKNKPFSVEVTNMDRLLGLPTTPRFGPLPGLIDTGETGGPYMFGQEGFQGAMRGGPGARFRQFIQGGGQLTGPEPHITLGPVQMPGAGTGIYSVGGYGTGGQSVGGFPSIFPGVGPGGTFTGSPALSGGLPGINYTPVPSGMYTSGIEAQSRMPDLQTMALGLPYAYPSPETEPQLIGGPPGEYAGPGTTGSTFNPRSLMGLTRLFGGTTSRASLLNLQQMFGIHAGASPTPAAPWQPGETPGPESLERAAAGGTSFRSVMSSPAVKAGAGIAGNMLFSAGAFGNQQGTALGMLETTAGGAGIGYSIGGPIGAGVGAAAGFFVGLGEMMAGVESPRHQAIRLAGSLYHIHINNSTADQIVAIAKQSYGGQVGTAVRSPEVRHMLGLYAAGTGQAGSFPMSSMEPHGASLVEQGGTLSQQATYQYGQAYTYASNLPVYGGVQSHPLSAPGGNVQLSLNIGGQDAAKFLQGNVVSPDVVQTQYSAAMQGSSGRVSQAMMMSDPGSIVGTVSG